MGRCDLVDDVTEMIVYGLITYAFRLLHYTHNCPGEMARLSRIASCAPIDVGGC